MSVCLSVLIICSFLERTHHSHCCVHGIVQHVITNDKVAVKVIDKTKLEEVELQHLRHEVRVMKLMRHPHVVRLYEV